MRFRYWFMVVGGMLVLLALFLLDPLDGAATASWMLASAKFVLYVSLVFMGYRAVTDYKEADGQDLHKVARTSAAGAGLALVARSIVFIAMALIVSSAAQAQTLPSQAPQHLPALK